jgi:uridine kinase
MRIGISGAHGTGKTTLAELLCAHLPGHVTADEPYYRTPLDYLAYLVAAGQPR